MTKSHSQNKSGPKNCKKTKFSQKVVKKVDFCPQNVKSVPTQSKNYQKVIQTIDLVQKLSKHWFDPPKSRKVIQKVDFCPKYVEQLFKQSSIWSKVDFVQNMSKKSSNRSTFWAPNMSKSSSNRSTFGPEYVRSCVTHLLALFGSRWLPGSLWSFGYNLLGPHWLPSLLHFSSWSWTLDAPRVEYFLRSRFGSKWNTVSVAATVS